VDYFPLTTRIVRRTPTLFRNSKLMKIETIVFDLFGTLVNHFPSSVGQMHHEMVAVLKVPYEEFNPRWNQTTEMRVIGAFETVEDSIQWVLDTMNAHARAEQIRNAVALRMRYIKEALRPKADAISTLKELGRRGYRLGLLSNCSLEIPLLWPETDFADAIDTPIFSCLVRLKKPDKRIYHLACERLGTKPESCLYIADGEDYELAAAASAGLQPVLIRSSSAESQSKLHREAREWRGAAISDLREVLALPFIQTTRS
jgi:putative hydrolase of the HAD superfamily